MNQDQPQEQIAPVHKDSNASQDKKSQNQQLKLQNQRKNDAKSIFIENVDYNATEKQLQIIFQDCGKVAKVTILKDHVSKIPKGNAYLSFQTQQAVQMALYLSGTKLRGRAIKVHRKRTNIRGMNKQPQNKALIMNKIIGMLSMQQANNSRGKPRPRGK